MFRTSFYRRLIWPAALCFVTTALTMPALLPVVDRGLLSPEIHLWLHDGVATLSWLAAAWFGVRLFRLFADHGDRPVPRLLGDLVALFLYGTAVIIVLGRVFHQPIGALVTTSGVVVAVLGFSLREVIGDLFAGLCINMERSYGLGDWLEFPPADEVGKVVEINWRATRLVTLDGITVVVPNGLMAKSRLLNYSTPKRHFRVTVPVVLSHEVPTEHARSLLNAAVRASALVLADPAPDAQALAFTDQGMRYGVRFWVPDYEQLVPVRTQVLASVHRHLRLSGVALYHGRHDVMVTQADRPPAGADGRRVAVLRHVPLFRVLTGPDLEELAEGLAVRELPHHAPVVRAGEQGQSLFVVVEGLLEVHGDSGVLAKLAAGDIFGEMSLLTGAPRSATVVAATEAVLFEIFDHQLRPILQRAPELAEALGAMVERRQRANQRRSDEPEPAATPVSQPLLTRIREFFALGRQPTT